MLVSMKMQTGVSKLELHSDKIPSNNRLELAPAQGKEPGGWKIISKLLLEVQSHEF